MKKKIALLLTMIMLLVTLTACGSDGEEKTVTNIEDGDPIQIAMIMFDWSDDQGKYLQECGTYLEENFNVEFTYVTSGLTAEEIINSVEEQCIQGVDGILNAMTDGFQAWAQICEDNEVFYSVLLNTIDEDDEEFLSGTEYFVGSAHRSDFTQVGKDYANKVLENAYSNVLFAGFSEGFLPQNDEMITGFKEVMDAQSKVGYKVIGAYPTDLFDTIAAELAGASYDGILASVSVMDFGVGNIFAANKVGQMSAIGHNIDPSTDEAFGAGIVTYITDNFTAIVNMNFVLLYNAIEGNVLPGTPEGYWNIEVPSAVIDNQETLDLYRQYVRSTDESNPTFAFNVEEIKNFIVSYNSEATYDEFKTFIEETTIEKISQRHK